MAALRAGAAVGAGIGLVVAAINPRPAGAQMLGFAAVAVSPTTLANGSSAGTSSPGGVGLSAIQGCQAAGAKDCKVVYSVVNQCVALAEKLNPNTYAYGVGATREAAAIDALAACQKQGKSGVECWTMQAPCSGDDTRWASPLPLPPGAKPGSVDPALVGLWKFNVSSGIWVWQISANGTYTFHSEATDKVQPHDGMFTASNGKYTLHSDTTIWDDQGSYAMQGSTATLMTGKLGTGTWHRIPSDPDYAAPAPGSVSGPASAPTIKR
jgi:hypothetical protein